MASNASQITVKSQLYDTNSVLHHYRRLIALRRNEPLVKDGLYRPLLLDHKRIWAYLRDGVRERLLVVNNFYSSDCAIELPEEILEGYTIQRNVISNYPDCLPLTGRVLLRPYESFVVHLSQL